MLFRYDFVYCFVLRRFIAFLSDSSISLISGAFCIIIFLSIMKTFTLNCFKNFKCAAGSCKHSCCVGWEIDIDKTALKNYRACKSSFSERLASGVDYKSGRFKMAIDGKCFFLNSDGLCELIINLGENALCQICRDHPRYRNFFSDRTEYGIGLCCEVGAAAIINSEEELAPVLVSEDASPALKISRKRREEEDKIKLFREKAFSIFSDKTSSFNERIENALSLCGVKKNVFFGRSFDRDFANTERLSDSWTKRLESADFCAARDFSLKPEQFGRLAFYFVHRHIASAIDETDLKSRLLFCVISLFVINAVYKGQLDPLKESDESNALLADVAREYSAEIEYSDDNVNAVLDIADGLITLSSLRDFQAENDKK